MIDVECGACGKRVRVKGEYEGKRIKCPGCGAGVSVPLQVVLPIDTAEPEPEPPARPDPPPASPAPPPARPPWTPFEVALIRELETQRGLLHDIAWYLKGLWYVFVYPVLAAIALALAAGVLMALNGLGGR